MKTIDGSSGGGSILRVAAALACGLEKEVKITNIRKNRSKPGLRPQHLAGLELVAQLSGSRLDGGQIGSQIVTIRPQATNQIDTVHIELATAASVSLIAQIVSNYSVISRRDVSFAFEGGGTHTRWSPNFDYLHHVAAGGMSYFGQSIRINLEKSGFYPRGGARGKISFRQSEIPRIVLNNPQNQVQIKVISIASTHLQDAKVAERQVSGFASLFQDPFEADTKYVASQSPGTAITCIARGDGCIKGASNLGERGVPAEKVGKTAAQRLIQELNHQAAVDEFLADQLLIPLACSPSGSSYTLPQMTNHVEVNMEVIDQLMDPCLDVEKLGSIYRVKKV